jgi:sterol desaturase/sphingolipid hydroxylase (fatty acid hydroxylase superfamily)
MPINKFLYFGDFLAIPLAVIVLAYFASTAGGLWTAPDFGVSLLTGLATWTLVEYAVHRFVYHHAPLFSALHDSHHQAPNAFIGVPSFVSSGFIIVVCYFPVRMFDDVAASGFTSGMLLGYAAYMFVHHATHHLAIRPGDWLYKARVRHMAHHYHDNANFGVSTGLWDWVFNTTGARRGRPSPQDANARLRLSRPEARPSADGHEHGNAPSPDEGKRRNRARLPIFVPRLGR